jgi:conjugal transfer pilus assembly protein TraU
MMKYFPVLFFICLFQVPQFAMADSSANCHGKFADPITDICWSCVFPMTLGGVSITTDNQEDFNSGVSGPICNCTGSGAIGVPVSFWEPARIVEAVRQPYCFVSLGGVTIDPGISAPAHARATTGNAKESFYQVHWYIDPLMYWLEILLDDKCLEQSPFDLAYFTEIDPLWGDSELTFILNPDAVLFANPLAQAACAADCVAATAGFPLNTLFWCAGCQGSMYPLDGWVGNHIGGVHASTQLVERFTNKMHREGLIWAADGPQGLCGYYPVPIMDKRAYKMQMIYPVPWTAPINNHCCSPFGRTTVLSGAGKEFPVLGEDFSYMLFRKRDCCQGAITYSSVGSWL